MLPCFVLANRLLCWLGLPRTPMKPAKALLHLLIDLIAVAFGVLTLFVGTRVLRGADPGSVVFRPLLVYNVVMGASTCWRAC